MLPVLGVVEDGDAEGDPIQPREVPVVLPLGGEGAGDLQGPGAVLPPSAGGDVGGAPGGAEDAEARPPRGGVGGGRGEDPGDRVPGVLGTGDVERAAVGQEGRVALAAGIGEGHAVRAVHGAAAGIGAGQGLE